MARGFTQTYRCYNYVDKNPVVDKMRTILKDEGFLDKKRRSTLHQLSGVSVSTYDGWFDGDTRNPRHETIMATMAALGYEEQFIKVKTIDEERELKKAADWWEKNKELRAKSRPAKKANGHKRGSRK